MGSVEKRLLCLEQLALALEQLKVQDPQMGRLGHILVDNAIELMLHFQAETVLGNKWLFPVLGLKEGEDNKNALGRNFQPKVSFARQIGVITTEQAEFILTNHEYRNELYHAGLKHEEIIQALAIHYYLFACQLFPAVKWGLVSWSSPMNAPNRLNKAWEMAQKTHKGDHNAAFNAMASDLAAAITVSEPLGKTLGAALKKDIRYLDEATNWILKHDRRKKSRIQVIVEAQLWSALFDEKKREKCRAIVGASEYQKYSQEYEQAVAKGMGDMNDFLKKILQPPINDDPIAKWRKRAAGLEIEKDYIKATKKYQSVMAEMSDLYDDIMQTAAALENHLEQLRGK